jgi:putative ABC transport system substrate-binding protein
MRRRDFIKGIAGSATVWPLAARAQQPATPVIGLLGSGSAEPNAALLDAFRRGLRTTGYSEDKNVTVEYRWADGNYDRLRPLADELARLPSNVLVAFDNTATALAAKAATSTIPIIFSIGTDPVKFGLVSSLSHPAENLTGVVALTVGLGVKRLQVLRQMVLNAGTIAILFNPKNPAAESETAEIITAANASGQNIILLKASTPEEIDAAFARSAAQHASGILIESEPFLTSRHLQMADLAAKYALATIDAYREYVSAGGLMSYGASQAENRRIVGIYAGRILKGDKPADLPVQQSTKIELVINLRVAQALNLSVPTDLLVRADEVIE